MGDLFQSNAAQYYKERAPLAERLRPRTLDDVVGQDELLAPGKLLRQLIETDRIPSMVLWGPPGTGKTTLAGIIAKASGRRFVPISAVSSGVKDLQKIIADAEEALKFEKRGTLLFIDEIHRFNKAQQDVLLHAVEQGTLTMIGATTENPSFEVNSALLSRARVMVLEALGDAALRRILQRALTDTDNGIGKLGLTAEPAAETLLLQVAAGDARRLLNLLELAGQAAARDGNTALTAELVREAAGARTILYDQSGEEHYNIISAFIKSMRGSDPDAAIYYLARMMAGGEDPLFIARRLVIFASEDIGNADPRALQIAIAAKDATHFVGLPECFYPLAQCTVYLATAPKSNAAGAAYMKAMQDVKKHGPLPVPLHIRNAPTDMMKDMGYGKNYHYPHDAADAVVADDYLPDTLRGREYYTPATRGYEVKIAEHLAYLKQLKTQKKSSE